MQQLRRSLICIMTLFLFVPTIAFAESYSLVMGKMEAVCKHMLDVFNEDLKYFSELQYGGHEEFTAIEWTLALDDYCRRNQLAQFDIDNDGHDDTVLKYEGCLRGVLDDNLFIYAEGKQAPQPPPHFVFDASVAKQASGVIGQFLHGMYELRKLPKFREGTAEFYRYIGAPVRINPFRFDGKYYVVIDDPFHFLNKGEKRFTAIVRTDKHGHLNDVCYFATKTFTRRDADVID